jgi:hypothetical protein
MIQPNPCSPPRGFRKGARVFFKRPRGAGQQRHTENGEEDSRGKEITGAHEKVHAAITKVEGTDDVARAEWYGIDETGVEFSWGGLPPSTATTAFSVSFSRLSPQAAQEAAPAVRKGSFKPHTPIAMDVLHSASALMAVDDTPAAAAFFGFMGCASALVFACTFSRHIRIASGQPDRSPKLTDRKLNRPANCAASTNLMRPHSQASVPPTVPPSLASEWLPWV